MTTNQSNHDRVPAASLKLRTLLGIALLGGALSGFTAAAAPGPSGGPSAQDRGPAAREPQLDQDRTQDRMRTMDRAMDQDRAREQDRDRDRDQDRDRDRVHQDEPIYGAQLMTEQERNQYREQMRAMRTEQERMDLRARHRAEMQTRAREQGIPVEELSASGDQDRLRDQDRDQLRDPDQDQDRDQLRDPDQDQDRDQDRLREHQDDGA